jgi:hypothetical protein
VTIIVVVWLRCTSNQPSLIEADAIQNSTRASRDTGKCLEERAQLQTEDPSLSGFED